MPSHYLASGIYSCSCSNEPVKVEGNTVNCLYCYGGDCVNQETRGVSDCAVWNTAFIRNPNNDSRKLDSTRTLLRRIRTQIRQEIDLEDQVGEPLKRSQDFSLYDTQIAYFAKKQQTPPTEEQTSFKD